MEHGIPREELSKIIDNIKEEIKSIHDEEWFQEYKYTMDFLLPRRRKIWEMQHVQRHRKICTQWVWEILS